MQRATEVLRRGSFDPATVADTITLDRESRYRRRVVLTSDTGAEFLLDLPEATYLAEGDALTGETGTILIKAAAEALLEIHAHGPRALARIAWHIGNRHIAAELTDEAIYIQPDHVLAEMIHGLGGHVHQVMRPFEPEGGAYGGQASLQHSHSHGHAQGHGHADNDDHANSHD